MPVAAPAITPVGQAGAKPLVRHAGDNADDVFTPRSAVNPVVAALMERGLYLSQLATGQHAITCPWAHEHAADSAAGATYTEPDERNPIGYFHCVQLVHEKHGAATCGKVERTIRLAACVNDTCRLPLNKIFLGSVTRRLLS